MVAVAVVVLEDGMPAGVVPRETKRPRSAGRAPRGRLVMLGAYLVVFVTMHAPYENEQ